MRASNPSVLTLDGTNTYVVGRWVVDPGPADADHLEAVRRAARHGIEGGADPLPRRSRRGRRPAGYVPVTLPSGGEGGAVPGAGYARALGRQCVPDQRPALLHRGHGARQRQRLHRARRRVAVRAPRLPAPAARARSRGPLSWPRPVRLGTDSKLGEYLTHRLERERRLVEALGGGARTHEQLLDAAWPEVPDELRPAAALTLAAHLEKLAEEGRLPADVSER